MSSSNWFANFDDDNNNDNNVELQWSNSNGIDDPFVISEYNDDVNDTSFDTTSYGGGSFDSHYNNSLIQANKQLQDSIMDKLLSSSSAVKSLSTSTLVGPNHGFSNCSICGNNNHATLRCTYLNDDTIPVGIASRLDELHAELVSGGVRQRQSSSSNGSHIGDVEVVLSPQALAAAAPATSMVIDMDEDVSFETKNNNRRIPRTLGLSSSISTKKKITIGLSSLLVVFAISVGVGVHQSRVNNSKDTASTVSSLMTSDTITIDYCTKAIPELKAYVLEMEESESPTYYPTYFPTAGDDETIPWDTDDRIINNPVTSSPTDPPENTSSESPTYYPTVQEADATSSTKKFCLTEAECRVKATEMNLPFFVSEHTTKGCYTKNSKVFYSPGGTEEDMSTTELSGVLERVYCEDELPWQTSNLIVEMAVEEEESVKFCLSQDECQAKSTEMNMQFIILGDHTTTKGCFMKNGKLFYSQGTEAEMSTTELSGIQVRVYCSSVMPWNVRRRGLPVSTAKVENGEEGHTLTRRMKKLKLDMTKSYTRDVSLVDGYSKPKHSKERHLEQDIAQQCKDLVYEAYKEEDCATSGKSGKSGPTSASEGKSGKSGPTSPSEGKSGKSGPTSPSAGKSGKSGSYSPSHGKSGKSGSKCQTPSPSKTPTANPTSSPTEDLDSGTLPPTTSSTSSPTQSPTTTPTSTPSQSPSKSPSKEPSTSPSSSPTEVPTGSPSKQPSSSPSLSPSQSPSKSPSVSPTSSPSAEPSSSPTVGPSASPTKEPSQSPSKSPSVSPTEVPTGSPSKQPSSSPTIGPSTSPTKEPTSSPSLSPSQSPSKGPSVSPSTNPTEVPTGSPSKQPTSNPSQSPSKSPSKAPSKEPTVNPSQSPSRSPSKEPSISPSKAPSVSPSTNPTSNPSKSPSKTPTANPTSSPSQSPSISPTSEPTEENIPEFPPTTSPTSSPTQSPTTTPTSSPTPLPTFSVSDQCTFLQDPPYQTAECTGTQRCCYSSNDGFSSCASNAASCGPGPASNAACIDAGLSCDLSTQFCCKTQNGALSPYACQAKGTDCQGDTVPAAAVASASFFPFDFESAAATKTDSNDMMSINGLGLSPTYYPTYYPTYTEDGNGNDVALSQSQRMSNLDESSAIRSVSSGSYYFVPYLVVIVLGLYVYGL